MGVKGITRDGIYNGLDSPRGETPLDRERAVSGGDNGEGKDGGPGLREGLGAKVLFIARQQDEVRLGCWAGLGGRHPAGVLAWARLRDRHPDGVLAWGQTWWQDR